MKVKKQNAILKIWGLVLGGLLVFEVTAPKGLLLPPLAYIEAAQEEDAGGVSLLTSTMI